MHRSYGVNDLRHRVAAFRERRLQFEAEILAVVASRDHQGISALAEMRQLYAEEALPTAMALWRAVSCAQRDARRRLYSSPLQRNGGDGSASARFDAADRRQCQAIELDRLALELREEVLLAEASATGRKYNAVWGGDSRWAARLIAIAEGECTHAREMARQRG